MSLELLIMIKYACIPLTLIALYYNVNKDYKCFYIWLFTNSYFIIYNLYIKDITQSIIWIIYIFFTIYGLYEWKYKKRKDLK